MNVAEIDLLSYRTPGTSALDGQFIRRWSPRAYSSEVVEQSQLETLFEAARWAPSCFNAQPWHFLYAHRDTPAWPLFFETLVEANQSWACRAGVLIAVLSRRRYERNDKPAPTHEFDAGAAWMCLALQADSLGLAAHGMQGFDADAARVSLKVPEVFHINAMVAVGKPGSAMVLSESQREREIPSDRKSTREFITEGAFEEG